MIFVRIASYNNKYTVVLPAKTVHLVSFQNSNECLCSLLIVKRCIGRSWQEDCIHSSTHFCFGWHICQASNKEKKKWVFTSRRLTTANEWSQARYLDYIYPALNKERGPFLLGGGGGPQAPRAPPPPRMPLFPPLNHLWKHFAMQRNYNCQRLTS